MRVRLPESSPLPSTRMPAPRMLGAEGGPGLCGGGARGSASSPLRPLPAHEHRLTFPAAVDLRLRAAEALPQDVLLHLCGDPLALRARAIAHQPPHPRPAATLCPETGGQAKARCHVKLNLDKTHKKEKLESGRCVGWSGAEWYFLPAVEAHKTLVARRTASTPRTRLRRLSRKRSTFPACAL